MPFGSSHNAIRALAKWAISSFYQDIIVIDGQENVPSDPKVPLIVCCNHWNMTPAVLSCYFPHGRKLHYWAKDSLFKNPIANYVLRNAGNIPVDRKTKNNQKLFAGTFEAFKLGESVAIFPEGTSYTEPGIKVIKDGASWAALEYAKYLRETEPDSSQFKDVTICVAGITYTEKSKYRSRVVMQFGQSIQVKPFVEQFLNDPKPAVKALTEHIREEMTNLIVDAPDWDTLHMAKMARRLLWTSDSNIPLQNFRQVAQVLVDLFKEAEDGENAPPKELRNALLSYHKLLRKTRLSSSSLGPAPLPRSLDPTEQVPMPTRLSTLLSLIYASAWSLMVFISFAFPMIIHLPTYLAGKSAFYLINSEEEESFAQNKVVLGVFLLMILYPMLFFVFWALLSTAKDNLTKSGLGALMAFLLTVLFAIYHNRSIDSNYRGAKRLVASWRVLVGVWSSDPTIRELLQVRRKATRQLITYLRRLEDNNNNKHVDDHDQEGPVRFLKACGARITNLQVPRNADEVDQIVLSSSE